MKKFNIFMLFIGALNFAACLTLLILCVPTNIPIAISITEKITHLASKWILLINVMLPFLLSILALALKNHSKTVWSISAIFVYVIYLNILTFGYVSIENSFATGTLSQIPLAASFFMPFSALITLLSLKLKNLPYNHVFGIKTKYTTKTEFIWKQTHFFAKDAFFAYGVLTFLISIIFVFVRHPYINLAIDAIGLILCFILTNKQAKIMHDKYIRMEKNKARLNDIKLTTK